nr:hypothetical protein [Tanacetum cinerariifolium]
MLLNLDQLEMQLDKEEFQETRSMDAFRVLKIQFQMFINFLYYFADDDSLMIRKYFLAYTRTEVQKFRDTLVQHMESVKESIQERAKHKREYDIRINDKMMQSKEGNVDSSKALNAVALHYLPILKDHVLEKSHHMIAPGSSRNSYKESYASNDMTHKYYLEEAKKKTQERDRKSTTSKCVFNANHDACITKFLKGVNYQAKVQSLKTRISNKPVKPTSHTQKPGRQIVTGNRFSLIKSSAVHEKTNTPRSFLRWISTGRIFNTTSLRWVPIGKKFTSRTTKVDCEPPNGLNKDITNPYECEQTLHVSAGPLNLSAGTSFNPKEERLRVWLLKRLMSKNQAP